MRHKALILSGLLLTACGSESGSSDKPEQLQQPKASSSPKAETTYQTFYVKAEEDLGECNEKKLSHLMYVKDLRGFFTCDGASWSEVDVPVEQVVAADDEADARVWVDEHNGVSWTFVGVYAAHPVGPTGGVRQDACELRGLTMPTTHGGLDLRDLAEAGGWAYFSELAGGIYSKAFQRTLPSTHDHQFQTWYINTNSLDDATIGVNNSGAGQDGHGGSAAVYCYE